MSRLICYAVDNAVTNDDGLDYAQDLPDVDYQEYAYADQAGKIARFLTKYGKGYGIDMLTLLRREIGIESIDELRLGLLELVNSGAVTPLSPPMSVRKRHAENYKHYHLVNKGRKIGKEERERRKRIALEKRARLDREIELLGGVD